MYTIICFYILIELIYHIYRRLQTAKFKVHKFGDKEWNVIKSFIEHAPREEVAYFAKYRLDCDSPENVSKEHLLHVLSHDMKCAHDDEQLHEYVNAWVARFPTKTTERTPNVYTIEDEHGHGIVYDLFVMFLSKLIIHHILRLYVRCKYGVKREKANIPIYTAGFDPSKPTIVFFHGIMFPILNLFWVCKWFDFEKYNLVYPVVPTVHELESSMYLGDYVKELSKYLDLLNPKRVKILAWSYGCLSANILLKMGKYNIDTPILIEPAGILPGCGLPLALSLMTYRKRLQVIREISKFDVYTLIFIMYSDFFLFRRMVLHGYGMDGVFDNQYHIHSHMFLSDKDLVTGPLSLFSAYTNKYINHGSHGTWVANPALIPMIQKLLSEEERV